MTKTLDDQAEVLMSDRDSFDIAVEGSPPVAVKLVCGVSSALLLRLEPKEASGRKKWRFLPFVWIWADNQDSVLWMALPGPLQQVLSIILNLAKQILPSIGLKSLLQGWVSIRISLGVRVRVKVRVRVRVRAKQILPSIDLESLLQGWVRVSVRVRVSVVRVRVRVGLADIRI